MNTKLFGLTDKEGVAERIERFLSARLLLRVRISNISRNRDSGILQRRRMDLLSLTSPLTTLLRAAQN